MPLVDDPRRRVVRGARPEKNGGPKLFCVSGHVKRPGVFEAPMKVTLQELIYDYAGGVARRPHAEGRDPGRIVGADPDARSDRHPGELRRRAEGGIAARIGGIMVLDDTTDMVWLAENLLHFYRHESCGKCTPCREGTDWLYRLLHGKIERRRGDRCATSSCSRAWPNNIDGKTLCAFGDAAATPVLTTLKWFRRVRGHIREGRCPRPPSGARTPQPVGTHWTHERLFLADYSRAATSSPTASSLSSCSWAADLGGGDGLRRAQGRGVHAAALGPYRVGPRACCSRSPTSSS